MTVGHRRGVTRGYVGGLVFAVVIVALALLVASWGGISLATGGQLVTTSGIGLGTPSLIVLLALGLLAWTLWLQSIVLLRGQRTPPWGHTLAIGFGGYLVWCLGGVLAGFNLQDTWLSLYAAALGAVWAVSSVIYWGVLARRVYTDRPTPQWPWEKRGEPGPDWREGENPWLGPEGRDVRDGYGSSGGEEDADGRRGGDDER